MADLPAELAFGYVAFQALLAVADTSDPGRDPDSVGATGTVTFTAKVPVVKTYLPNPATIGKQVITCTLDANGYLKDPAGNTGVYLVTGLYVVTYALVGVELESHDILVEASHTLAAPLDLTTAIPPSGDMSLSQYSELNTRVLSLESRPKITAAPAASPPPDPVLNQIWVKY